MRKRGINNKIFFILIFVVALLSFASAAHPNYPAFAETHDFYLNNNALSVSDDIIYKIGYYSVNGAAWQQFQLQGTPYGNGQPWLLDNGQVNLPPALNNEGTHYIILFSCSLVNNAWDCHGDLLNGQIVNKWQLEVVENEGNEEDINLLSEGENVLVFLDQEDYNQLGDEMNEFKQDVENNFPLKVKIISLENLKNYEPSAIREILINNCGLSSSGCNSLEGAIFVGDIPYTLYSQKYSNWDVGPFMFYYQDLDATFRQNSEGYYYEYENFGNHEGPEIYISWIKPIEDASVGTYYEQLRNYFEKHHRYLSGTSTPSPKVVTAWHTNELDLFLKLESGKISMFSGTYQLENIIAIHPTDINSNILPLLPELKSYLSEKPEVAFLHSHGSAGSLFGMDKNDILELEGQPLLLFSWGCSTGNLYNTESYSFPLAYINGEELGLSFFGKIHSSDINHEPYDERGILVFRPLDTSFFEKWNSGDYVGKIVLDMEQEFAIENEDLIGRPVNLYRDSGPLQRIIIGSPFVHSDVAQAT